MKGGANVAASLFSGIGGMDEGLRRAGWEHAFLCESDPYRRDVLRARFPGVPVYDDVREVAESPRPERLRTVGGGGDSTDPRRGRPRAQDSNDHIDLLCGGFPCQDVSVAGKRRGLDGERSGLFFEFARIAESLRPDWLLVENVPGLLSSNGGRDFGVVLGTMADIGYGVAWRIVDSRYFGVPQRRRRVFIVGAFAPGDTRGAAERAGEILAVGASCDRDPSPCGTKGQGPAIVSTLGTTRGGGHGLDAEKAAGGQLVPTYYVEDCELGTLKANGSDGFPRTDRQPLLVSAPQTDTAMALSALNGQAHDRAASYGVRRLTPVECERLQGFPDGWTELGKTADSKRYAGLGDAVTVPVAEWIGRRMLA